jgi:hypothetical protein
VLVGATSSSFQVRVYNSLYPDEVAGAVPIEATDPDVFAHSPAYMKGRLGSLPPFIKKLGCDVLRPVILDVGLLRLIGNPGSGQPYGSENLSRDQQAELSFLSKNPGTVRGGEGCDLEESMAEVRAAGDLGNRPLIVLASSKPFKAPPGGQYAQATADFNEYWFHQLQPHLAALSTRGELVFVADPEGQDAIVPVIGKVVGEVRTNRPPLWSGGDSNVDSRPMHSFRRRNAISTDKSPSVYHQPERFRSSHKNRVFGNFDPLVSDNTVFRGNEV